MTRDPDLGLSHRTGPQARDRFRLKFPAHYQDSEPLPLPDPSQAKPRLRSRKARLAAAAEEAEARGESSLQVLMHDGKRRKARPNLLSSERPSGPAHKAASSSTEALIEPSSEAPLLPSPQSPSIGPTAVPRPSKTLGERRSAATLVMPLPSPKSIEDGRNFDTATSSSAPTSPDEPDETEAETGRHLGILGLLNDEDDAGVSTGAGGGFTIGSLMNTANIAYGASSSNIAAGSFESGTSRLPPFKNTFDEWTTVDDSVELPPLLWEDMASRPMFELD